MALTLAHTHTYRMYTHARTHSCTHEHAHTYIYTCPHTSDWRAIRMRIRTPMCLRMRMRLMMRVRAVYIACVCIPCLFGAVLWSASDKILYQPARPFCLGQGFYGRDMRVCIGMLRRLRVRVRVWMRVWSVYCACMDSLPFR